MRFSSQQASSNNIAGITGRKPEQNLLAVEEMNSYLPLGINMAGRKCLIVGAGKVAARKAQTLLKAGAVVTVLSPEIENDWLKEKVLSKDINYIESEYVTGFLDDYGFIIAATSNSELNAQIAQEAENKEKLGCVVSSSNFSRVIFPAVHRHDGITVAVHSNGRDCRRSKWTRDSIAYYLNSSDKPAEQLLVFGFKQSVLPGYISRALRSFARQGNIKSLDENVLILSTCQRWECYISGTEPRSIMRKIISLLQQELNYDWEKYASSVYFKQDSAAYHHLVRIIAGLDSPLTGETGIIGQIRSAMSRYLSQADQQLSQVFEGAMLAGRKLRNSCELEPAQTSWAQAIISFLRKKVGSRATNVLVIGTGRLTKSVVRKSVGSNYQLKVLSDDADEAARDEFGELKIPVHSLSEIVHCIEEADAMIICAELNPDSVDSGKHKFKKEFLVLDVEGNNEFISTSSNRIQYYKAKDIVYGPSDVHQAVTIATAELKAIEQSLFWYCVSNRPSVPADELRIGVRPSELALAQVDEFVKMLKALYPRIMYMVETISTPGDRDRETPLPEVVDDDFFTYDIDKALLAGRIDIAVHSAKDMPRKIRPGLHVTAVTPGIAPWECLVSKSGLSLMKLPPGAVVGTSSQRRRDQLKKLRPDLVTADVRGNVPERLKQLEQGKYDALILASAGLIRLGMEQRITEIFSEEIFPYTPGQGSLAIVVREADTQLQEFLRPLNLGSKEGLPWL